MDDEVRFQVTVSMVQRLFGILRCSDQGAMESPWTDGTALESLFRR